MQSPGRNFLGPLVVLAALAGATPAFAAPNLVGTYVLIQDDDGTAPRADALISLTFMSDGSVVLSASLPDTDTVTDKGTWSLQGEKLSLLLPGSGKVISQGKFSLNNRELVLPFRVFSDAEGKSRWRRSATISLRPFAKDKEPEPPKAVIVPATPKTESTPATSPGEVIQTPTVPAKPAEAPESAAPPVSRPPQVFPGPSGVGTAPTNPEATPKEASPSPAANTAQPKPNFVGKYQGSALGAEVRYRKEGVFTLTAKHTASFWFTINEKGEIKGAGQITYALDADRKGNSEEAGEVENFPTLYTPGGSLIRHSPALVGGTVTKDIELKGTYNPQDNTVTLLVTSELGDLVYEYESRGKRATKPFPAWSPFPDDTPATLEVNPDGSIHIELDLAGKARRDKWQEFRFLWSAKKIN